MPDRVPTLTGACDLDLLLFFARHPFSLLTSPQLAALVGYGPAEIAESLERLSSAGIVARTERATPVAGLFVFTPDGADGQWLPSLLELGSTRAGRLTLLRTLAPDRGDAQDPPAEAR